MTAVDDDFDEESSLSDAPNYVSKTTPKSEEFKIEFDRHEVIDLDDTDEDVEPSNNNNPMSSKQIFRYRADAEVVEEMEEAADEKDTESKLYSFLERVCCFLKGMPVYYVRRRLIFIIIFQALISTFRILPIILGLSYQSVLPVFILYVTLILGWHGVKFLVPRFLLMYQVGMQLSLWVDVIWYIQGWNGPSSSSKVSEGTAFLLQATTSAFLLLFNILGLLFGWKLRRIVKGLQNQREYDRATMAEGVRTNDQGANAAAAANNHLQNLRQQQAPTVVNVSDPTEKVSINRKIFVGQKSNEQSSSHTISSNKSDTAKQSATSYCSNEIRTSKYTYYNFLYVFFRLQFSRLANCYTTIIVGLCFFEFSPVSPVASFTPLLIVFASSAFKDVMEDLKRQKADTAVNEKPVTLTRVTASGDDVTNTTNVVTTKTLQAKWKDLRVGDLVVMKNGDEAPADILLLSTSQPDGRCYVATANLDGETSLKIRTVPSCTRNITSATEFLKTTSLVLECDQPNSSLFDFNGSLSLMSRDEIAMLEDEKEGGDLTAVSMENMILRGSELKSSEWTIGLVVYTGVETRISLNASTIQQKRSLVEKNLNSMLVLILVILFTIAVACSLGNNDWQAVVQFNLPRYLSSLTVEDNEDYNNFVFLSYVILFNNMIPLSMYVTMEGVRFVYARYIESDLEMYDELSDTPAQARNSNIVEDLGQIQYIFSDKTGTLTQNEMRFAKCTIAGLKYGDDDNDGTGPSGQRDSEDFSKKQESSVEGVKFRDPRLLQRLKSDHSSAADIHEFLLALMICNTVVPSRDPTTGKVVYQASSPDEEALVLAAKYFGYVLKDRDGPKCFVSVLGEDQVWEILAVLEFNSDRKRMSVLCRGPDGLNRLFCKGADNKILERLQAEQSQQGIPYVTLGHLQEYAADGLRTLCIAMKVLSKNEFEDWYVQYQAASNAIQSRGAELARVAEDVESTLKLLGSTAIEDRLQDGVQDCISCLREAGINFWVLTGDKKETAISVGTSSQVIDDTMAIITLDHTDKKLLYQRLEELYVVMVEEKTWGKESDSAFEVLLSGTKKILSTLVENILSSLSTEYRMKKRKNRRKQRCREVGDTVIESSSHPKEGSFYRPVTVDDDAENQDGESQSCSIAPPDTIHRGSSADEELEYGMVIDGETLTFLLEEDMKFLFLAVARECKSVICCRCSPSQKADVVKLVTQPKLLGAPGFLSLAIGDGANDVPMIQSASVGVGISGKEGRQAVLSSDYSIAQFKFLKRLLLVHGNYSYKRISKLILFSFMKNIALSISNFWFAIQTKYSGLLMYFGILFTLYNALFTTIPIVFVAIYNQDVSTDLLMQHPPLYRNGLFRRSFNWTSFFGWCVLGVWHAYVIFAVPFTADGYYHDYLRSSTSDLSFTFNKASLGLWADGMAAYTYLIAASTLQVSLLTSNWTKYNISAVAGTIVFYIVFIWFLSGLFLWTGIDVYESYAAAGVVNRLFCEPWFWLGLLLASVTAVFPNYVFKSGRVLFYPEPSHLMREWNRNPEEVKSTRFRRKTMVRRNTGFAFSQDTSKPDFLQT